eukprot:scaffold149_cov315-Pinguiococcus_pyrenoidosus.AAC.31
MKECKRQTLRCAITSQGECRSGDCRCLLRLEQARDRIAGPGQLKTGISWGGLECDSVTHCPLVLGAIQGDSKGERLHDSRSDVCRNLCHVQNGETPCGSSESRDSLKHRTVLVLHLVGGIGGPRADWWSSFVQTCGLRKLQQVGLTSTPEHAF